MLEKKYSQLIGLYILSGYIQVFLLFISNSLYVHINIYYIIASFLIKKRQNLIFILFIYGILNDLLNHHLIGYSFIIWMIITLFLNYFFKFLFHDAFSKFIYSLVLIFLNVFLFEIINYFLIYKVYSEFGFSVFIKTLEIFISACFLYLFMEFYEKRRAINIF